MCHIRRLLSLLFASLLIATCLCVLLPSPAAADGGAPNLAYVAGTSEGISIIDIVQQKMIGAITLPGDPQMILLSLDGSLLYVAQPQAGRITFLATATKQPVCTVDLPGNPSLLALDASAHVLYAAGNHATLITALDATTCAQKYKLQTRGNVYGLALAQSRGPSGNGNVQELWVADETSLYAFNGAGKLLATLAVDGGPQYLSAPPGQTLYVTTRKGSVRTVDLSTRHLLPFSLRGGPFGPMDFDETTGEIYIPDSARHQLVVSGPINAATADWRPARIIHLNGSPQSIAITSDGQFGFVALESGDVTALDIPGRQVFRTFHVGGSPRFIITGLYPSLLHFTPQQRAQVSLVDDLLHYAGLFVILLVGAFFVLRERWRKR